MIEKVYEYNQHFVAMMNVINAARLNPPVSGHKHHIIPKAYFKMHNMEVDNSESNLVLLSLEDHQKIHKLIVLCVKDPLLKSKMGFAVHRLGSRLPGQIHHSEHAKELLRKAATGNKNCLGKKWTDAEKKKSSDAHKGQIAWNKGKHGIYSEETLAKLSAAKLGTHVSDETRRKMSEAQKGHISAMKGRTQSEEAKKLIGRAAKGRKMPFRGKTWKLINGKRVWIDKEVE